MIYKQEFTLEHCYNVLKDHQGWLDVEMPTFYKSQGRKKSKTSETTSGSASGGINLNDEADEDVEETQEVRPMGRDQSKAKKKSASSSRGGSSSFVDLYKIRGGGGVVAVEAGGDEMMVVGGGDAHDEVVEDDGDAVVAGDDAVVDGDDPASLVLYVFLYLSLDIYIVNKVIEDWVKQLTRQKGYTEKMVEEANGMCVRLVLIASGSFEEVCSRLKDLLDTLPTLLSDNEGLSKDDLVQWRFLRFTLLIHQKAWIRWALDSKRHGSGVLTLKVDMQSVLSVSLPIFFIVESPSFTLNIKHNYKEKYGSQGLNKSSNVKSAEGIKDCPRYLAIWAENEKELNRRMLANVKSYTPVVFVVEQLKDVWFIADFPVVR
ncbi:DNA polymerase alpha subunit B [Tanacetum coccineum]